MKIFMLLLICFSQASAGFAERARAIAFAAELREKQNNPAPKVDVQKTSVVQEKKEVTNVKTDKKTS